MGLWLLPAVLDVLILCCLLYFLLFLVTDFLKQLYIRILCGYKGVKEKTGPACAVCAHRDQCGRARKKLHIDANK